MQASLDIVRNVQEISVVRSRRPWFTHLVDLPHFFAKGCNVQHSCVGYKPSSLDCKLSLLFTMDVT